MNTIYALVAVLLLASCSNKPDPNSLIVPTWACSQTPTGESRIETRQEYCGRGCSRPVVHKQYAIKVACEYKQWTDE